MARISSVLHIGTVLVDVVSLKGGRWACFLDIGKQPGWTRNLWSRRSVQASENKFKPYVFAETFTVQLKIFFFCTKYYVCGPFYFWFARFVKWTHSFSVVCSQRGTFISVTLYHAYVVTFCFSVTYKLYLKGAMAWKSHFMRISNINIRGVTVHKNLGSVCTSVLRSRFGSFSVQ